MCKKLRLQVAVSRFKFSLQVAVTVCVNLSLQVASCNCDNLSLQAAMILFYPRLQVAMILTNCFMLVMVALLHPSLQVAVSQAYTWSPRTILEMSLSVTSSISNLVVLCSISAV